MKKTIIYAQHMDSDPLSEDGMILSEAVKATGTVMRVLKKTSCLVMSALLVFGVCGCRGGRSTGRQYEVVSDLQSVESNADGQSSAVDSEEKQDGTSNHKTVDQEQRDGADSRPVGNEELDDWDDGVSVEIEKTFEPMVVPSRKNAYKLSNTYRKIKNGETVTVAYCGGSVSGGTGASDDTKTSWRALTTAYLRSVAAGQVKEIDATMGGAGSYLGAARFEYEVSSKTPDLVFLEFAVNDGYSGLSNDQSKADIEYMIRNLYQNNPYADIVLVLVTNQSLYGSTYEKYKAQREVADHYRIPVVDLGGELYNQLKGSISGWIRNFNDSVHPNDNGHRLYADIMIGALKELLVEKPVAAHTLPDARAAGYGFSTLTTVMPDSFTDKDWTRYRWLDNTKYEKSGCQFRYSDLKIQFPEYLAPKDGASLSVSFTGNSFGFLGTVKEGTTLVFSIDGGQIKRIKGEASASAIEYPVFENLKNGDHTVHITIAGGEPYAAVAAFVVTGD